MGTALVGTIVTGGYVRNLEAHAPVGVPAQAVQALHSPNVLVNQEALQQLGQRMATVTNGPALMPLLLDVARVALAGAIRSGFLVIFGAALLAFASAFLMANLRLADTSAPAVAPADAVDGQPDAGRVALH